MTNFLRGLDALRLSEAGIPKFNELSQRLKALSVAGENSEIRIKWRNWFWRGSLALWVAAIVLVMIVTWVPAEESIQAGRDTHDIPLIASVFVFAPLLPLLGGY